MRNLLFTLGLLTTLLSYSSITSTFTDFMGQPAFEMEVIDPAYMPAYYYNPITDSYPVDGWSYLWQTDEGTVSHAEKPVFCFSTPGAHIVSVVLVPRKKDGDIGMVTLTNLKGQSHRSYRQVAESLGNKLGHLQYLQY